MKKTIAVLFAIASAAVFAGMNDVLVSFNSLYTPDTEVIAKPLIREAEGASRPAC